MPGNVFHVLLTVYMTVTLLDEQYVIVGKNHLEKCEG